MLKEQPQREPESIPSTIIKLVRDATGGVQLKTESGEVLKNVFVKEYTRVHGSVTRINMEVIFISSEESVKNW